MILIASAAVVSLLLIRKLGMWPALGVWAAVAAPMGIVGTVLLRTSALGRVTWKNRLASYLMPWGARLKRGRLWPIPVMSWVVWMFIAVAVAALVAKEGAPSLQRVLLLMAWCVDAAAVLYLAGTLSQGFEWHSRSTRTLLKLELGNIALLTTSTICFVFDEVPMALAIAGGPPLLIACVLGIYFGVLILADRNARWN